MDAATVTASADLLGRAIDTGDLIGLGLLLAFGLLLFMVWRSSNRADCEPHLERIEGRLAAMQQAQTDHGKDMTQGMAEMGERLARVEERLEMRMPPIQPRKPKPRNAPAK